MIGSLIFHIRIDNNEIYITESDFNLSGVGKSIISALVDALYDIDYLYSSIYKEKDENLTKDAIELKNRLKVFFETNKKTMCARCGKEISKEDLDDWNKSVRVHFIDSDEYADFHKKCYKNYTDIDSNMRKTNLGCCG